MIVLNYCYYVGISKVTAFGLRLTCVTSRSTSNALFTERMWLLDSTNMLVVQKILFVSCLDSGLWSIIVINNFRPNDSGTVKPRFTADSDLPPLIPCSQNLGQYYGKTVLQNFSLNNFWYKKLVSSKLTDVAHMRHTYYRPIFNSWQSGSGDLHAAPFTPMGFVTAAHSRDPIKWVRAPYHVTCHVTFVCTLSSLPSDTPWRMNTSLGLIRPADRVCNECRSSVTWPLALYARNSGSEIHKVRSGRKFF
jgi:hypothetical protein